MELDQLSITCSAAAGNPWNRINTISTLPGDNQRNPMTWDSSHDVPWGHSPFLSFFHIQQPDHDRESWFHPSDCQFWSPNSFILFILCILTFLPFSVYSIYSGINGGDPTRGNSRKPTWPEPFILYSEPKSKLVWLGFY